MVRLTDETPDRAATVCQPAARSLRWRRVPRLFGAGGRFAALLILSFFLASTAPSQAAQSLVLVTGATPPWGPGDGKTGYLIPVAKEAFKRIGVTVKVLQLPAERVLENVNNGIDDGDIFRIGGMEKKYPNLRMVAEPIAHFDFCAFVRRDNASFAFSGWPSLKKYDLAMVTGWKFYQDRLLPGSSVMAVSSPRLLFGMLRDKKVDAVLFEHRMGEYTAAKEGVAVRAVQPPFARVAMHIYLNKKFEPLVAKVSKALVDMRADGTLAKIRAATIEGIGKK